MRPFRVFNRVSKVPVMWKVAGVRLGGIGQLIMLSAMVSGLAALLMFGLWQAAVVFGSGAMFVLLTSRVLRRLDPDEAMGDLTAFLVLWRGLRHRHSGNYAAWSQ